MRRTWLVLTWVGATALVSWVTFQALATAQEGVGDATLPPVVVEASGPAAGEPIPEATVTAPSTTSSSTSTTTGPTPSTTLSSAGSGATSTPRGSAPGTTLQPGPTTTTPAPPTATAPTTTSPTTTATSAATWQTHVVSSGGGTVTVRYRPGEVQYQAAVPASGYQVEVDSTGPEVRVEFVGESDDWDVRVRWRDDALDIDIND